MLWAPVLLAPCRGCSAFYSSDLQWRQGSRRGGLLLVLANRANNPAGHSKRWAGFRAQIVKGHRSDAANSSARRSVQARAPPKSLRWSAEKVHFLAQSLWRDPSSGFERAHRTLLQVPVAQKNSQIAPTMTFSRISCRADSLSEGGTRGGAEPP